MSTNKRVLVTGGAGFIGRRLVQQLVLNGYSITILDNLSRGDLNLIPKEIKREIEIIIGDTRNADLVMTLVKNVDSVIHLAAGSAFFMYEIDPIKETQGTIDGFINVIEAMRRSNKEKIVYASTSAVYEGNILPYREDMKLTPPDLKAISKKVNEDFAHLYSDQYGIKAIGLRPFNVYGEGEISKGEYANTVSLFVWAMLKGEQPVIWGNGEQTRDFIYVDDVVEAFKLSLEKDINTQEFNVGTGQETSINQLVKLLIGKLNLDFEPIYKPVPIKVYAKRLVADIRFAEKVLNFRAQTTLSKGADKVIEEVKKIIASKPELSQKQYFILDTIANREQKHLN